MLYRVVTKSSKQIFSASWGLVGEVLLEVAVVCLMHSNLSNLNELFGYIMLVFLILTVPASALKIAFGSCAKTSVKSNPQIWKSIADWTPQAFVWLGDAVYADQKVLPFVFRPTSRQVWASRYQAQLSEPTYQVLANSTRVLGVWDDHDYGLNNGDSHFTYKELSRVFSDKISWTG